MFEAIKEHDTMEANPLGEIAQDKVDYLCPMVDIIIQERSQHPITTTKQAIEEKESFYTRNDGGEEQANDSIDTSAYGIKTKKGQVKQMLRLPIWVM